MFGFPFSHTSPWAELGCAGALGFAAGLWILPDPAPIALIGWIGWALLAPLFAIAGLVTWLVSGSFQWFGDLSLLAPLGWTVISVVIADIAQSSLPVTFSRRLAVSCAAPAVGASLVAGLSAVPWHLLPWS